MPGHGTPGGLGMIHYRIRDVGTKIQLFDGGGGGGRGGGVGRGRGEGRGTEKQVPVLVVEASMGV